jgi:hypothetical protein
MAIGSPFLATFSIHGNEACVIAFHWRRRAASEGVGKEGLAFQAAYGRYHGSRA